MIGGSLGNTLLRDIDFSRQVHCFTGSGVGAALHLYRVPAFSLQRIDFNLDVTGVIVLEWGEDQVQLQRVHESISGCFHRQWHRLASRSITVNKIQICIKSTDHR